MAKWHAIKAMSAFARTKAWKVHHLDVKMVFLNDHLWEKGLHVATTRLQTIRLH